MTKATNAQSECYIYCSSTATIVTRTRFIFTLYVHWVSCLI